MQVTIQSTGIKLNKELKAKIERKLQFTLSKVQPYIITILINLTSTNDTRGIANIHCQLTLAIVNQSNVVIKDTQIDLECVLDRVLQKASRMIERLVFNP